MSSQLPKMYNEMADWWPLLSNPAEYAEEAEIFRRTLLEASPNIHTLLELGSGGGNNASHLKHHLQMTLVDLSENMLATSRRINPDLPHFQGDMRTVRLGKIFDAVFIHDAVMYMTREEDLFQAIQTAAAHLDRGGTALFVPDHVTETFRVSTSHGGHDGEDVGPQYAGKALRYMEWTHALEVGMNTFRTDYTYLLREIDGQVRCIHDQHTCAVFPRQTWLDLMQRAGFKARLLPFEHSEVEPGATEMILGIKI